MPFAILELAVIKPKLFRFSCPPKSVGFICIVANHTMVVITPCTPLYFNVIKFFNAHITLGKANFITLIMPVNCININGIQIIKFF